MAAIATGITKQPFKLIEIPLNKFSDEAVPHHQAAFEAHKSAVQKLSRAKNVEQLRREVKDKKRVVRQLKDLMYELDTLRAQVEDSDLAKFDSKTLSLRKTILGLISGYTTIETDVSSLISQIETNNGVEQDIFTGTSQIQIQENLSDIKLQTEKQLLQQVEVLHQEIEEVHQIFTDLNQMVDNQKEHVTTVETNTEVASENVTSGLRQLIQASKLKRASYPVAGAFIGTVVGGPIGSVAGIKIGGLAAIGCGLIGYISGRFIKKVNEEQLSGDIDDEISKSNADAAQTAVSEKKDI